MAHQNDRTDATTENLIGVGQRILGNLESIGAVLTGDPVTNAEGAFNANVGTIHQESSSVLRNDDEEPNLNRSENDLLDDNTR